VRLPSVNHSRMEYTAEDGEDGKRALRVGLMQVKGLRMETITAIPRAREEGGAFLSLEDFLRRVPVECDEIKSLIKCGALDEIGDEARRMTRPECSGSGIYCKREAKAYVHKVLHCRRERTFYLPKQTLGMISARCWRKCKRRIYPRTEAAVRAGNSGSLRERAPLDFLSRNGEAWSDELPSLRGKRVTLCGWVVTHRHVGTKKLPQHDVRDPRGSARVYEVVLFPNAYDKYGGLVYETRTMRVTGRVEPDGQINGEKLEALKK